MIQQHSAVRAVIRCSGEGCEAALTNFHGASANHFWQNSSVSRRDTSVTVELKQCEEVAKAMIGALPSTSSKSFDALLASASNEASLSISLTPRFPKQSFPTACICSVTSVAPSRNGLSTSRESNSSSTNTASQGGGNLSIPMRDVVIREWVLLESKLTPNRFATQVSVRTLRNISSLVSNDDADASKENMSPSPSPHRKDPPKHQRLFITLRFVGCCDQSDQHAIDSLTLSYVFSSVGKEMLAEAATLVGGAYLPQLTPPHPSSSSSPSMASMQRTAHGSPDAALPSRLPLSPASPNNARSASQTTAASGGSSGAERQQQQRLRHAYDSLARNSQHPMPVVPSSAPSSVDVSQSFDHSTVFAATSCFGVTDVLPPQHRHPLPSPPTPHSHLHASLQNQPLTEPQQRADTVSPMMERARSHLSAHQYQSPPSYSDRRGHRGSASQPSLSSHRGRAVGTTRDIHINDTILKPHEEEEAVFRSFVDADDHPHPLGAMQNDHSGLPSTSRDRHGSYRQWQHHGLDASGGSGKKVGTSSVGDGRGSGWGEESPVSAGAYSRGDGSPSICVPPHQKMEPVNDHILHSTPQPPLSVFAGTLQQQYPFSTPSPTGGMPSPQAGHSVFSSTMKSVSPPVRSGMLSPSTLAKIVDGNAPQPMNVPSNASSSLWAQPSLRSNALASRQPSVVRDECGNFVISAPAADEDESRVDDSANMADTGAPFVFGIGIYRGIPAQAEATAAQSSAAEGEGLIAVEPYRPLAQLGPFRGASRDHLGAVEMSRREVTLSDYGRSVDSDRLPATADCEGSPSPSEQHGGSVPRGRGSLAYHFRGHSPNGNLSPPPFLQPSTRHPSATREIDEATRRGGGEGAEREDSQLRRLNAHHIRNNQSVYPSQYAERIVDASAAYEGNIACDGASASDHDVSFRGASVYPVVYAAEQLSSPPPPQPPTNHQSSRDAQHSPPIEARHVGGDDAQAMKSVSPPCQQAPHPISVTSPRATCARTPPSRADPSRADAAVSPLAACHYLSRGCGPDEAVVNYSPPSARAVVSVGCSPMHVSAAFSPSPAEHSPAPPQALAECGVQTSPAQSPRPVKAGPICVATRHKQQESHSPPAALNHIQNISTNAGPQFDGPTSTMAQTQRNTVQTQQGPREGSDFERRSEGRGGNNTVHPTVVPRLSDFVPVSMHQAVPLPPQHPMESASRHGHLHDAALLSEARAAVAEMTFVSPYEPQHDTLWVAAELLGEASSPKAQHASAAGGSSAVPTARSSQERQPASIYSGHSLSKFVPFNSAQASRRSSVVDSHHHHNHHHHVDQSTLFSPPARDGFVTVAPMVASPPLATPAAQHVPMTLQPPLPPAHRASNSRNQSASNSRSSSVVRVVTVAPHADDSERDEVGDSSGVGRATAEQQQQQQPPPQPYRPQQQVASQYRPAPISSSNRREDAATSYGGVSNNRGNVLSDTMSAVPPRFVDLVTQASLTPQKERAGPSFREDVVVDARSAPLNISEADVPPPSTKPPRTAIIASGEPLFDAAAKEEEDTSHVYTYLSPTAAAKRALSTAADRTEDSSDGTHFVGVNSLSTMVNMAEERVRQLTHAEDMDAMRRPPYAPPSPSSPSLPDEASVWCLKHHARTSGSARRVLDLKRMPPIHSATIQGAMAPRVLMCMRHTDGTLWKEGKALEGRSSSSSVPHPFVELAEGTCVLVGERALTDEAIHKEHVRDGRRCIVIRQATRWSGGGEGTLSRTSSSSSSFFKRPKSRSRSQSVTSQYYDVVVAAFEITTAADWHTVVGILQPFILVASSE